MNIVNLKKYSIYCGNSFILKLSHLKDLVLFNCCEGLQCYVIQKKLKINHISRIILTDLSINNTAGLLGLLSSLNSIGRVKDLHIYGPLGLEKYLDFGKKYSHTNFGYVLYIHILTDGLSINHGKYRIYSLTNNSSYEFFILCREQAGKFRMKRTSNNYVKPSPLYSSLKIGKNFLLPDGLALDGHKFTYTSFKGQNCLFILNKFYDKTFTRNVIQDIIILNMNK
uniref:Ribonuclease Z n=1 Tax=Anotrichium furcellatum TaxID=41999 RepID=A0A4D6WKD1_9FLOR|nr:ribonuclease Z [Anotrichium furcellatum]